MTLAFPAVPGNTVVTGPVNNHQLEPNSDGSLNVSNGGVAPQTANDDGVNPLNIILQALAAYVSGGPVLASGVPSQLAVDRLRALEGKKTQTVAITSTTAGDPSLICTAGALKLLTPGHKIQLSGGAVTEEVVVADSYVISTSATSIPLKSPVVNTGQTTAKFDSFDPKGPGGTTMTPDGILPFAPVHEDITQRGSFYNFVSGSADAQSAAFFPEFCMAAFNGNNTDRVRGNVDNITLINATAVSTTQTSADQTNFNGRGLKVWWNITTFGAALTLHIDYKDPVSGQYLLDVLVSAAISANTFTQYTIYPGITTAANVSLNDILPRTWRVRVTGASGSTFAVAVSVMK